MDMRNKSSIVIVLGVAGVVVLIVAAFSIFRWRQQDLIRSRIEQETLIERGDVQTRFLQTGLDRSTPDALPLSRVVRGYIDSQNLVESSSFVLSTQINWPEEQPQRLIPFLVTATTEYLCWGEGLQHPDGTYSTYAETIFMLDDTHKLFAEGQKPLTQEQAADLPQKGTPVILGLQQGYINNQVNNVFQIAIIGCQDNE